MGDGAGVRERIAVLRARLERLLLWRVWERMLEIEFIDRSIALAGKAFVSFFPLVIVVAAFMPERIRSSIITSITVSMSALRIGRSSVISISAPSRAPAATATISPRKKSSPSTATTR